MENLPESGTGMTLILTDISRHGVAMAADTAESIEADTESGRKMRVSFGMKKLQRLPGLSGMVGTWGFGKIGLTPTDLWLEDFVSRHGHVSSLDKLAHTLRSTVQKIHGAAGSPELGFRLSGFNPEKAGLVPVSYRICNYDARGGVLSEFEVFSQKRFSNLDNTPWSAADGDITFYQRVATDDFRQRMEATPDTFPAPANSLFSRADFLVACIRFVSDLHHCAGLARTIGGGPVVITISSSGVVTETTGNPP